MQSNLAAKTYYLYHVFCGYCDEHVEIWLDANCKNVGILHLQKSKKTPVKIVSEIRTMLLLRHKNLLSTNILRINNE